LPSKEELMAQIAGALNALATKAVGINGFRFVRSQPEGSVREGTGSAETTLLLKRRL